MDAPGGQVAYTGRLDDVDVGTSVGGEPMMLRQAIEMNVVVAAGNVMTLEDSGQPDGKGIVVMVGCRAVTVVVKGQNEMLKGVVVDPGSGGLTVSVVQPRVKVVVPGAVNEKTWVDSGQPVGRVTVVRVGPPADTMVVYVVVTVAVGPVPPVPPPPVGVPQGSVAFGQPAGGPRLIQGHGGGVSVRLDVPTPPGPGTAIA